MSILWAGGEDIDFPQGSGATVDTVGGRFRSGYARCCLYSATSPTPIRSLAFSGGAVTSAWLSQQWYQNSPNPNTKAAGLVQSSSGKGLFAGNSSTSLKVALWKYDGTTYTQLAAESGTSIPSAAGVCKVDMQVQNYGTTATVNVYLNGTLVITFSGDVTVSGMTNMDGAAIVGSSGNIEVSEVIVADEDTRSMSLVTMAPNAAGTTDQWTGAYTNVNPVTINDGNADFTNTTAQDQQYNLIDLPSGSFQIKAVKIAARAMHTSGSTATGVQLGVNSGGTVNVGSTQTVTSAFTTYERLMATNPVTSAAWAQSDMNPLQVDLRSA